MTHSDEILFDVPEPVRSLCARLNETGAQAFLVGGSLRDLIRGEKPYDWDIATSATPEQVINSFRRVIPTGIAHGTVTVIWKDIHFEVTTFRGETGHTDGRRPDHVNFINDIEADLSRRDFTVNAIAWDPITCELHDPFGGRRDIQNRQIVAVGDPATRFREDGLRIMRGARFAATLGFQMNAATLDAVRHCADCLKNVSTERKRDEFTKLLMGATPSSGLNILADDALLRLICPPLQPLFLEKGPNAITAAGARIDRTPAVLSTRLASLLLDSTADVAPWMETFLFDRQTRATAVHLLHCFALPRDSEATDAALRHLASGIGRDQIETFLSLLKADQFTRSDEEVRLREKLTRRMIAPHFLDGPLSISELATDGKRLMRALSLQPGPQIGTMLRALLDAVLDDPSRNTPETLESLARDFLKQ